MGTQCYEENEGGKEGSGEGEGRGKNYNERERGEWNEKSNHAILFELREFECQSFHEFLSILIYLFIYLLIHSFTHSFILLLLIIIINSAIVLGIKNDA